MEAKSGTRRPLKKYDIAKTQLRHRKPSLPGTFLSFGPRGQCRFFGMVSRTDVRCLASWNSENSSRPGWLQALRWRVLVFPVWNAALFFFFFPGLVFRGGGGDGGLTQFCRADRGRCFWSSQSSCRHSTAFGLLFHGEDTESFALFPIPDAF